MKEVLSQKATVKTIFLFSFMALIYSFCDCSRQENVDEFPGEYSGIGVELEIMGGFPMVKKVFNGGQAKVAGLKKDDKILEIDGVDTYNMSLGDIVMLIRGPTGSQIVLAITGKGRPKKLLLPINRGKLVREGEKDYAKSVNNSEKK